MTTTKAHLFEIRLTTTMLLICPTENASTKVTSRKVFLKRERDKRL